MRAKNGFKGAKIDRLHPSESLGLPCLCTDRLEINMGLYGYVVDNMYKFLGETMKHGDVQKRNSKKSVTFEGET